MDPLFYEFIFNLSFDPHLVCPSGFMLSPWGTEVMVSCHVTFFVLYVNPVLQIKMTTIAPPGHVHEYFSTVIVEVKLAPVDKRKLVLHYIGRSLHACLLVLLSSHCLVLSRSKHDSGSHTLSLYTPLVTDPAGSSPPGKVRRCNVHAVILVNGSYPLPAHPDQHALLFSPKNRWRGRASDPFFLITIVWADPASRRPPSDIPATIRYNFLRNRPCSTSRAPDVATFVSFTSSQAPSCR